MRKALLVDLICSFFVLLFLYTALSKLFHYTSFQHVLQQSPLLGDVASVVALVLPVTEIGISLLLLFPLTRLSGLYVTLVTLTSFTIYLSYMIAVAPKLPCSCGGVLKQLSWRQHLVFNGICILIALMGITLIYLIRKQNRILPGFPPRPSKNI